MRILWQNENGHKVRPLFQPMNPYSAANTDFYEITTSVACMLLKFIEVFGWKYKNLMSYVLTHDAYFRKFPAVEEKLGIMYGFMIQSGVGPLVDFLLNAHFTKSDINDLKGQPAFLHGFAGFKEKILDILLEWHFSGNLETIPEGMPVAPFIPLARITGNPVDTHIAETMVLMCLNTGLAYTTKARRISHHAQGLPVIDMAFRRMMMGVGGTSEAVRAIALGGFSGTSHTQAGRLLGIKRIGTHPHSWIMLLGSDETAFEIYGVFYPENYCGLVDTFDTLRKGVPADIAVVKKLLLRRLGLGHLERKSIRWSASRWREFITRNKERIGEVVYLARNDSGDQAYYSREMMRQFEEAGIEAVMKIVITGDLDEYTLNQILGSSDEAISFAGAGTKVVSDLISPGVVYKLVGVKSSGRSVRSVVKSGNPAKGSVPFPNVPLVLWGSGRGGNLIQGYILVLPEEAKGLRNGGVMEIIHPASHVMREKIHFDSSENPLRLYIKDGRLNVPEYIFTDTSRVVAEAKNFFDMLPDSHKRIINPQRIKYGLSPALFEKREKLIRESHRVN